jgi:hypothetical protein
MHKSLFHVCVVVRLRELESVILVALAYKLGQFLDITETRLYSVGYRLAGI